MAPGDDNAFYRNDLDYLSGMMTVDLFGVHDYPAFVIAGIALNIVPGQDTLYIPGRDPA